MDKKSRRKRKKRRWKVRTGRKGVLLAVVDSSPEQERKGDTGGGSSWKQDKIQAHHWKK